MSFILLNVDTDASRFLEESPSICSTTSDLGASVEQGSDGSFGDSVSVTFALKGVLKPLNQSRIKTSKRVSFGEG